MVCDSSLIIAAFYYHNTGKVLHNSSSLRDIFNCSQSPVGNILPPPSFRTGISTVPANVPISKKTSGPQAFTGPKASGLDKQLVSASICCSVQGIVASRRNGTAILQSMGKCSGINHSLKVCNTVEVHAAGKYLTALFAHSCVDMCTLNSHESVMVCWNMMRWSVI